MLNRQHHLMRERRNLLEQWSYAPERERAGILVRIMDIDDQLQQTKHSPRPRALRKSAV